MNQEPVFDQTILLDLINLKMPFGKYRGTILCELPISYLEWFLRKDGFPKGRIGLLLSTTYEIKSNGLEDIIFNLRKINRMNIQ